MSPGRSSATRMLASITSSRGSFSRPASYMRTGGNRMPSWYTSVDTGVKPPGVMPPTSGQCPVLATIDTRRPSWKQGRTNFTSIVCVPPR